jgi:hypothetical protein
MPFVHVFNLPVATLEYGYATKHDGRHSQTQYKINTTHSLPSQHTTPLRALGGRGGEEMKLLFFFLNGKKESTEDGRGPATLWASHLGLLWVFCPLPTDNLSQGLC